MLALALVLAAAQPVAPQPAAAQPVIAAYRWPAGVARLGAAADRRFVYAIGNNQIGKYDKRSGRRIAGWTGDTARFPHINACSVDGRRLICAASNYPAVPMASTVEIFDTRRMRHVATLPVPPVAGSLTWIEPREGGGWWAGFANYDGRGGAPGRDHRDTFFATLDKGLAVTASWRFPPSVLARLAPYSASGGAWGADGLLYVTGHDRPELYALRVPEAGGVLKHVATLPVANQGQAIGWDPTAPRLLWSISRRDRALVASRVPVLDARSRTQ